MGEGNKAFGQLLRDWRNEAKLEQREAAEKISAILSLSNSSKKRCYPNELSNYENGTRKPSAETLAAVSKVYKQDFYAILHVAFLSEHLAYLPAEAQERDVLWRLLTMAVKRLSGGHTLPGFEREQLRAFISFGEHVELLDTEGQRTWERSLSKSMPPLECFWVAGLDFLDSEPYFELVRDNIAAGALYVYFVRERYMMPGGRFDLFQKRIMHAVGPAGESLIRGIPFHPNEEFILALDFVVANPHRRDDCVGFRTIWKDDVFYNLKLDTTSTQKRVESLSVYIESRKWKPTRRDLLLPRPPDMLIEIPNLG